LFLHKPAFTPGGPYKHTGKTQPVIPNEGEESFEERLLEQKLKMPDRFGGNKYGNGGGTCWLSFPVL